MMYLSHKAKTVTTKQNSSVNSQNIKKKKKGNRAYHHGKPLIYSDGRNRREKNQCKYKTISNQ